MYIEVFIDIISCPVGIGVHFFDVVYNRDTKDKRGEKKVSMFTIPEAKAVKLHGFSSLGMLVINYVDVCFSQKSSETGMQKPAL